jgi:predicted transcriptional regulator
MYLFDDVLAASDLFGSTALLALRHENVYYRAAKPLVQAPSHAIWYVSSGRHDGVMSARAISTIEEVAIDSATLLYKRFRRLGVYEWQNVLETARGDPNAPIMALRFSGTVMLSRPVPLAAIRRVLGKSHTLQSPLRIQSDQFARIVEIGGIPRAMGHTERT